MSSGKFDEELARMSQIVDHLTPGSTILFNEPFTSTNEREGSHIARDIIRALRNAGVRVLVVTHQYDLAHTLHAHHAHGALFLRAQREPDGQRTYLIQPGQPQPTSHGQDLYQQIFTTADQQRLMAPTGPTASHTGSPASQ